MVDEAAEPHQSHSMLPIPNAVQHAQAVQLLVPPELQLPWPCLKGAPHPLELAEALLEAHPHSVPVQEDWTCD